MTRADPIALQQSFWNGWNASFREQALNPVSARQAAVVCGWLEALGRKNLDIIEVGCGSGWFCPELARFGRVTGTDLSDEVLARARHRVPHVNFVAGDFMEIDFGSSAFDVVVTLEVLSHVADQRSFVRKLARHLRPGGHLMLATQNRFVLEHLNRIPPPAPGQLRRWVDRHELRALLEAEFQVLEIFSVSPRVARRTLSMMRAKLGRGWRRPLGDRAAKAEPANHPPGVAAQLTRWAVGRLEAMGLGWTLMALARKPVRS